MLRINEVCTSVLLAVIATGAPAGPIYETNGNRYELETVSGLLGDLLPTLQSQPWFGNEALARDLANAAGGSMGLPNVNGMYGPMFATSIHGRSFPQYATGWVYYPNRAGLPDDDRAQVNNFTYSITYTFAVGTLLNEVPTVVPEPSHLAFVGIAAMLLVRRKRSAHPAVVRDSGR